MTITRLHRAIILSLCFLAFGAADAFATHFRYGTIRWQPTATPRQITFTVNTAWRRSFFGSPAVGNIVTPGSFCFGDGVCVNLDATVTSVNAAEDWIETVFTTSHVYPSNGTFTAEHTNCCRLSSLANGNNDQNWIIRSTVQVGNGNTSPASGMLPIVTVPGTSAGAGLLNMSAAAVSIIASDPNGNALSYAISTSAESGLPVPAPAGLTVNSATGVISWASSTVAAGSLHAVQFKVTDSLGASIPIDVILRPVLLTGSLPTMLINGSPSPQTINATIGVPMSFTFSGVDPDLTPVGVSASGMPVGATTTPSVPYTLASSTVGTFNWTPPATGTFVISFQAKDASDVADSNTATIVVSNQIAPTVTTVQAAPNPAGYGNPVTLTATVSSNSTPGGPSPAGQVQFFVDGLFVSNVSLSALTPQTSQAVLGGIVRLPGSHTVTANYLGATVGSVGFTPSSGGTSFTVNKTPSITTLTSSVNPSQPGQNVLFTATVASGSGSGTPAGIVTFKDGAVTLANLSLSGGTVSFPTASLLSGTHNITAEYLGDSAFDGSVGSLIQTVLAPPPFSQPFDTPEDSCICTPLLMNTDVNGTQQWYVKAGSGNFDLTVIAHAVNTTDPETVVARVYNSSNVLVQTLTASYGVPPTSPYEVSASATISSNASATFRVAVTTPGASPQQPHYRLKFTGVEAAGTASPSSPSFEEAHDNRWYFNTAAGEALSVGYSVIGTPSTASAANYRLTDPTGAVTTGSVSATTGGDGTIAGAAAAVAGTWELILDDNSGGGAGQGHYRLDKVGGADRGIYLGWKSAGEGKLVIFATTPTVGGSPFTEPVTYTVTDEDGAVVDTGTTSTGLAMADKLAAGTYTVTLSVPTGWSLAPSSVTVNVYCDENAVANFGVFDDTPPVVTAPNITAAATSIAGAVVDFAAFGQQPTANDPGRGPVTPVTCTPASGSTFGFGFTPVHCEATDQAGNVGSADGSVVVQDQTPPAITHPGNQVLEAAGPGGTQASFTVNANDTFSTVILVCDAIGPNGTLGSASSSSKGGGAPDEETKAPPDTGGTGPGSASVTLDFMYPLGVTTISCTATDAANNVTTSAFTVTVQDTTPPVLSLTNFDAEATSSLGAAVSFIPPPSASDLVSGSVNVSCSANSGDTFPLGANDSPFTTVVTCSATDGAGNTGHGSFTVTVHDTTPPALTVPPDQVAEATSPDGASVTFAPAPSATDAVDPDVTIVCTPSSGSLFGIGSTPVNCVATDNAGNSSSASLRVEVQDTTPPVLTVPSDFDVEASGSSGAAASFSVTADDIADEDVTIVCTPPSGSTFPLAPGDAPLTSTVECTATDDAGNSSTESFHVTVHDTTPPALTMPASQTLEAVDGGGAPATFAASATDDVDADVTIVCTPASGSTFALGLNDAPLTTTVNCTATDNAGNSSSGSFTVTVHDTTPPSLTVPPGQILEATGSTGAPYSFTPASSDSVDTNVSIVCTPSTSYTYPLGPGNSPQTTTVSCTATDNAGNATTESFTATVQDTTPPVLTLPANVTTHATSTAGATVTFSTNAVDVVAGTRPVSCQSLSGTTFALGTTTVNCTTTDNAGNQSSGSFTITVANFAPVCSAAAPSISEIWPPNHQLIPISINGVSDADGDSFQIKVTGIFQDESTNSQGDGNTPSDASGLNTATPSVRSERSGQGNGRMYHILFTATDIAGATCTGEVKVGVPHDQGKKKTLIDGGMLFNSVTGAPVQ